MDARIIEFAEVLRQNGLKASTAEIGVAASALVHVGLSDRRLVRAALRSTLCKTAADAPAFDRAFDLYFSGATRTLEGLDRSLAQRLRESGLLEGDSLLRVLASLDDLAAGLSPLAQALVAGNRAGAASLLRGASLNLDLARLQNPLQVGFFSRRLLVGVGFDQAREELASLAREWAARGLAPDVVTFASKEVAALLREVEDAARLEIARQAQARLKQPGGGISARPLHSLSRAELTKAQVAVKRLAEKLKARLMRRQRSQRPGALNVRATLRGNLSSGGIPMVPRFRKRRPLRPDVVVLCDVSDSVRNTSRVMLLFAHTLQSLFARVRSFVFVSDVGDITRYFKEADPEAAIDLGLSSKVISLSSNSNYGNALSEFVRAQLGSITRRTTVIVIGDGRNNYNPPALDALFDLKKRSKRLLWVCPEPRSSWGFGDSEMLRYARACHQVVTVQSLEDLERLAQELVPV